MIKRASASAGVLHFLFYAEGRVAPVRQSPLQSRQATGGDLLALDGQPGAAGLFNCPRERQGHPGVTVSLGFPGFWALGAWALGALGWRRRGLRPSNSGACFGRPAKVRLHVSSAIRQGREVGAGWALGGGRWAVGRWVVGRWVRGRVAPVGGGDDKPTFGETLGGIRIRTCTRAYAAQAVGARLP